MSFFLKFPLPAILSCEQWKRNLLKTSKIINWLLFPPVFCCCTFANEVSLCQFQIWSKVKQIVSKDSLRWYPINSRFQILSYDAFVTYLLMFNSWPVKKNIYVVFCLWHAQNHACFFYYLLFEIVWSHCVSQHIKHMAHEPMAPFPSALQYTRRGHVGWHRIQGSVSPLLTLLHSGQDPWWQVSKQGLCTRAFSWLVAAYPIAVFMSQPQREAAWPTAACPTAIMVTTVTVVALAISSCHIWPMRSPVVQICPTAQQSLTPLL